MPRKPISRTKNQVCEAENKDILTSETFSDIAKPVASRRKYRTRLATERFWPKVEKTSNCWNWIAGKNRAGYGVFALRHENGKSVFVYAHRFSYEIANGEIPAGLVIDHMCYNRACVNPDHLQAVTHSENCQNLRQVNPGNKSSGLRGVTFRKDNQTWQTYARSKGKKYNAGYYPTLGEAAKVVVDLRNQIMTNNLDDKGETE